MAEATDTKMTLERLRTLLGSYGGVAEKWPVDERAAALALIVEADAARAQYIEAARLDDFLDRLPEPHASPALAGRITALPLPGPGLRTMFARLAGTRASAPRIAWQGAVAVAAVIGMAAGIGLSSLILNHPPPGTTTVVVIDSGEPGPGPAGEDGEDEPPEVALLGLTGDLELTGNDGDGDQDILEIPVT